MTIEQVFRTAVARVERETGFEPATPTLARLCSTAELFPRLERVVSYILRRPCYVFEPNHAYPCDG